jgi:hypothetical protein
MNFEWLSLGLRLVMGLNLSLGIHSEWLRVKVLGKALNQKTKMSALHVTL